MKRLKNAINWFDIPVNDIQRAKTFYEKLLDVELQLLSFGNGLQMAVFPVEEGCVSGALTQHPDHYVPSKTGSLVYLNGNPDLGIMLEKVEPQGGKILMPKSLISEHWGHMALFEDTEGNRIALHSIN